MSSTTAQCNKVKNILGTADKENLRIDIAVGISIAVIFAVLFILVALWRYVGRRRDLRTYPVPTTTYILLFLFLIVFPALLLRRRLHDRTLRAGGENPAVNLSKLCDVGRAGNATKLFKECEKPCESLSSRVPPQRRRFDLPMFALGLAFLFIGFAFFGAFVRRVSRRQRFVAMRAVQSAHNHANRDAAASIARPDRPAGSNGNFKLKIVTPDDPRQNNTKEEDTVCAICIGELWDAPVAELSCTHRFHHACAQDWLRKAPIPLCPLCKAQVRPAERGS